MKLNALLAKTDSLASGYRSMIDDFSKFFSKSQGAFLGMRKTYVPKEGTMDDPSMRSVVLVQTTVGEKFDWLKQNAKDYLDSLFSQERTNASGSATAELVVEGVSWGTFTSLELLRLKGVVEDNKLYTMFLNVPVRSDSEQWSLCNNEQYPSSRGIMESPIIKGVNKTTEKESYILPDPNVSADSAAYKPQVALKNTTVELGDYTSQKYSGEMSQRERAEILRRRTTLITAVTVALKECNEVEVVESSLTSDRIFGYLLAGNSI